MSVVYRAAVIGAGMGGKLSMRALMASARYQLVAVADLSEAARAAAQALCPEIEVYGDHRALLAGKDLDVVCVSTWPPSHLEITLDALERPLKGLLVEKPLADTAADGRRLLDQIQAQRLPVVVPHGLLVLEHVGRIMDLVREGAIGQLELVEIQCTGWDIINAGIHWLDFCVALLAPDRVAWVIAACDTSTRTYRDNMQVETMAVTYAQSEAGVRIVMQTGDYVDISRQGKDFLFRLAGTAGIIEFYGWESSYRLCNADHPQGQRFEVPRGERSAHQRYLEQLAAQIDSGKPDYRLPEHSLAALEVCEGAYLSCRHRCQVALPLSAFTPPPDTGWMPGKPYAGGGGRDGRTLQD